MKLATLKDGSRDGLLVVVSRDLGSAHFAVGIATTLQQVLDDWNFRSPPLQDLYATLNGGKARHAFAFEPRHCMAPLPRAYQRLAGNCYRSHVERLLQAGGDSLPPDFDSEPQLTQASSDDFLGPCDEVLLASADGGIDFAAELAVISGDVDIGSSADAALEGVRLLMLANHWRIRERQGAGLGAGDGGYRAQPATAFAPVAVTPDELGAAWRRGRVHAQVDCRLNGRRRGLCETGPEMQFHFGQLMAQHCQTRRLRAGALVVGGTISNADGSKGCCCTAEVRAIEMQADGAAKTNYLRFGDRVRIEVLDDSGHSLFGAIDQRLSDMYAPAQTPVAQVAGAGTGSAAGAEVDAEAEVDTDADQSKAPSA